MFYACFPFIFLKSTFYSVRLATQKFTFQHTHTHTLFKNTQQTCMNKMQMTITKEKKITTYTFKKK